MTLGIRSVLIYLLDILAAVLSFFLGLRIVLELFAANPDTPIVAWIYTVSSNLMTPFSGILPNLSLGGPVLDIVAIITLIAYLLVIYLVMSIVGSALGVRSIYGTYRDRVI